MKVYKTNIIQMTKLSSLKLSWQKLIKKVWRTRSKWKTRRTKSSKRKRNKPKGNQELSTLFWTGNKMLRRLRKANFLTSKAQLISTRSRRKSDQSIIISRRLKVEVK